MSTNIPSPYRIAFFQVFAEVLAERDIEFEVFYYAPSEPNRHWTIDLASQRYRWTLLPGLHPVFRGIYPHVNPTLPFLLRRRRATWILIAGAWNTPSSLLAASRTLSGPGYRLFWSEGHAQAVLHPGGPIAALRRACWRGYDGFAVPNESSERFVHEELAQDARRASRSARAICLRLPNTVDEDFYLAGPGLSRDRLRDQLGLSTGDLAILCVAELADRKGVLELARAAALLPAERRRRAVFVFAGDGPLRGEVEALGQGGRFRLLGHLGQGAIRDWMYGADLFVLPSKVDPNPLSAIEAAFCGMPLLMSARAGNAEDLVGGGACGWTLPSLEPAAIAAVLERALALPDGERVALGECARQVARARFSRRDVAVHFVDELLAAFPAPDGLAGG